MSFKSINGKCQFKEVNRLSKTYFISIFLILVIGLVACSQNVPMRDVHEIVDLYHKNHIQYQTISLNIRAEGTAIIDGKSRGSDVIEVMYHRDHDQYEWIGTTKNYDKKGEIVPSASFLIRNIVTENRLIELYRLNPEPERSIPYRAHMRRDYDDRLALWSDQFFYGKAMEGYMPGNRHLRVSDLLSSGSRLKLYHGMENVKDIPTYRVETITPYGKVEAWIAPSYGYQALRWRVTKSRDDLYIIEEADKKKNTIDLDVESIVAEFVFDKVQKVNEAFVISAGIFTMDLNYQNRNFKTKRLVFKYKRSEIDLSPDFEVMGAFQISLPEGTLVFDKDLGVRYTWKGGKLWPAPWSAPQKLIQF